VRRRGRAPPRKDEACATASTSVPAQPAGSSCCCGPGARAGLLLARASWASGLQLVLSEQSRVAGGASSRSYRRARGSAAGERSSSGSGAYGRSCPR
jgi:hypothetical protein